MQTLERRCRFNTIQKTVISGTSAPSQCWGSVSAWTFLVCFWSGTWITSAELAAPAFVMYYKSVQVFKHFLFSINLKNTSIAIFVFITCSERQFQKGLQLLAITSPLVPSAICWHPWIPCNWTEFSITHRNKMEMFWLYATVIVLTLCHCIRSTMLTIPYAFVSKFIFNYFIRN